MHQAVSRGNVRERFLAAAPRNALLTFRKLTLTEAKKAAIRCCGELWGRNVVGAGIGSKMAGDKLTNDLCVRFYVRRKLPEHLIPRPALLPSFIDGLPTDVIETGKFVPASTSLSRPIRHSIRPPQPGCSIGVQRPSFSLAGTLGAIVADRDSQFLLTCNHVIADDDVAFFHRDVLQPGPGDQAPSPIATVSDFVRIRPSLTGHLDAAIARLTIAANGEVLPPIGRLASASPIAAYESMTVEKVGRSTGFRTGTVIDAAADVVIPYSFGPVNLRDQILIADHHQQFAANGDSGAMVVDAQSKRATGLLCGISRSTDGTIFAVANHISKALEAFEVELVL